LAKLIKSVVADVTMYVNDDIPQQDESFPQRYMYIKALTNTSRHTELHM